jgi:protein-L-isoaspartate(D-aspartate) O-methyltransferase
MPPAVWAAASRAPVRSARRWLPWLLGVLGTLTGPVMTACAQDPYAAPRRQMVEEIARMARDTGAQTGRPVFSARVMAAMAKVPRHRLVPADEERNAYHNRPLSIGQGQTISQPYIVALMTELLDLQPGDRVLEIGTGSGYQAAVLAELAHTVYTVEIVEPLARESARRLAELGYRNIFVRTGDGHHGWPEHAPFDAIMVTAAAREVPRALLDQLKPGGRLVVPVGDRDRVQTLYVLGKDAAGAISQRAVLSVRFVPMTGGDRR